MLWSLNTENIQKNIWVIYIFYILNVDIHIMNVNIGIQDI
jgi:hypothetical protein